MKRTILTLSALLLVLSACSSGSDENEEPSALEPIASAPVTQIPDDADDGTGTAADDAASDFRGGACSTTITGQQVDGDIEVPAGATCALVEVAVDGNIEVRRGGALGVSDSTIDGNIEGDGHDDVRVRDSRVRGNIQLEDGGSALVSGVTIDGNLQSEDNAGRQEFSGNTIDGNLQCEGNQPAPTGGNNRVGGNKEDQCASL